MEIEINNKTQLADIRREFKIEFPYLDIAFFSKSHNAGDASAKKNELSYDTIISDAGDSHRIGLLQITGDQTIAFTESEFKSGFGLHVQVLRKSGNLWLQTTVSDNLTLEELHAEAKLANEFEPDKTEPEDYQEQE